MTPRLLSTSGRCPRSGFVALAALSALLAPRPAHALAPDKRISQLTSRTWSVADGLPQAHVRAIAQTPDGFLWIATDGGIARFDGAAFVVFDATNTPLLDSANVRALLVDRAGTLWIGTSDGRHGLITLQNGRWDLPKTGSARVHGAIALVEDDQGAIWIGTWWGLQRLHRGVLTQVPDGLGDARPSIHAFARCPDGGIWFGTGGGTVARIRGKRITRVAVPAAFAGKLVSSLACAPDGTVWAGSAGGGLAELRANTMRPYTTIDGLPDDAVRSLAIDGDGSLWVGTRSGPVRLRGAMFDRFPPGGHRGLDLSDVLAEDSEGNMWVGSSGGGLTRLGDGPLTALTPEDGLPVRPTVAVHETGDGALWIGSRHAGLVRYQGGRFQQFAAPDGMCSIGAQALWGDRQGALWIGGSSATGAGLCRYFHDRFTPFVPFDEALRPVFAVRSVYEDRKGRIWVGANGLYRIDGERLLTMPIPGSPPGKDEQVYSLLEDRTGRLWIGTNRGVRYRDGETWGVLSASGIVSPPVQQILETRAGDLWFATQKGIVRNARGRLTAFTFANGLFHDRVFSIVEDDRADLWMSTPKGIWRLRAGAIVDDRIPAAALSRFGSGDGMKADQAEGDGGHSAGVRGRDGRIWFPTSAGVVFVDPTRPMRGAPAAAIFIESVVADGHSVPDQELRTIPPGRRDLEIRYTKPTFTAAERIRFRYRLDGFDEDWIQAGARRAAFYTNVPPGRYLFRVQATDGAGVFGPTEGQAALDLRPRIHETALFRAAVLVVLALLMWLAHRVRLAVREGRHVAVLAERNRIAQDIHDTLAQTFTGIAIHLETAKGRLSSPDQAQASIVEAQQLSQDGVENAREAIWNLRAQALSDRGIVEAFETLARKLGAATPVRVSVKGQARFLSARQSETIVQVGEEAITNAVRHGRAKSIDAELTFERHSVRLSIHDDGVGFDVAASRPGRFGLAGMRERMESLGGRLAIESRPGAGTRIVADLPEAP